MDKRYPRGFTLIEVLIVIAICAVLATVGIVTYVGIQRRSADSTVMRTIADAQKTLQTFEVFNHYYPANIANTDYAPPISVAVVLYTDAAQTPVYSDLTPAENAQLFLNACNGFLPIEDDSTTYNTACVYDGNNAHIKGNIASNVVIPGPIFYESDFVLTCGDICTQARDEMIAKFLTQGGTFPISVPKTGSVMPAPAMVTFGNASTYCLEGRSPDFPDIVYHTTPESASMPELGPCPENPSLHYP